MSDDNKQNTDPDIDEDDEDLPVLDVSELGEQSSGEQDLRGRVIVVRERIVPSLMRIVAFANKDFRPLSFEQCVFKETRLHAVGVDLSFEDSVFVDNVQFGTAVFTGKLDFWETSFENEVLWRGAVFKQEVSFDECLFASAIDLTEAVFERKASFTSCEFEGDVVLDNAKFVSQVDLSHSTFLSKMSCRHARFESRILVTGATFEVPPDTIGSNFEEAQRASMERPAPESPAQSKKPKRPAKKPEFNPWRELDKASKKSMTRRHLLRGLFRFLPEDKEE